MAMFDGKNIKRYYLIVIRKIRNFLLSEKSREFLVFLFFVFVSLCFWFLQTMNDVYQTEFKIPVRLKNVPKEVVMTSELPSEIKVKVEDRGTVLLNYMLGKTFFPLTFNFEDYQDKGSYVRIPQAEVLKKITLQLNNSTRLLSIRPDTLDYIYSKGVAKKVPVAVGGEVSAGRQYYVSEVKTYPDSVMVYAPAGVLSTILTAYTQPFHWTNVTDTVRKHVNLQKLHGVKFVPSSVDVAACVDMYSEKTLEVPVIGMGFPKGKVLRTFPSKVQITFQVGLKNFKRVKEHDFLIGVSYADVIGNKSEKLHLTLRKYPDVATHIRINPSSVDYLIEQQTVETAVKKEEAAE